MSGKRSVPYIVEALHKMGGGWLDLGGAWITKNVATEPLSQVRVAHLTPAGEGCKGSGGTLANHKIVTLDPLTITASLACTACAWHGYIRDGKWVPV